MEPTQTPNQPRHLPAMIFSNSGIPGQAETTFQSPGYGLSTPSSTVASRYRSRQEPAPSPYRGPNPSAQKDIGGPPAQSLAAQMEPLHISDASQTAPSATPHRASTAGSNAEETPASASAGRWVTVFGFAPVMTEVVLQHFHSCGEIIRVRHASNQGNWMHIMFQTTLQAQKALGKSGKIIQGNLMIGVVPCIDERAISEVVETPTAPVFSAEPTKPFIGMSTEYSVDPSLGGPTPRAERGFWSKVTEYIIGV
eukprot:TRINITY_DN8988_c0_g1_i1.p1 TRINITY_DN8988_c0_g1~~TRINITY_DN8988_c0_g1_i1.p1  ORF type:complete len:253 (-),score=48.10 TRINITY_DN8988_c0_g1_i1:157-915(-)